MNFETFFRSISYAAVFCGFVSLWVTGTFGVFEAAGFIAVLIAAWFLEGSRWLISERIGTALIVLSLPVSYLAFKLGYLRFYGSEAIIAGILARMILTLSAIKLLQKKSDRDWIFLYLMSFFEVLLAAGLSISLMYLSSFLVYLLLMVCAAIAFEMRKTASEVDVKISGETAESGESPRAPTFVLKLRRLPTAAVILIALIAAVAIPLFFVLPRVGGAGLGGMQNPLSASTGFSESVRLGGTGRLQQNDTVVMRVKIDGGPATAPELYFRGVAMDTFDNVQWSRSKRGQNEPFVADERGVIQVDYASGKENLLVQTVYLEPLETPVLFAVPKAVAVVDGNFSALYKDRYGAITFQPSLERSSYKVLSDTSLPTVDELRSDNQAYAVETGDYLQLPEIHDRRIDELAVSVAGGAKSRYDKAVAIESYLRNNYGYSLEMRSGGPEPVADFLFRVREGHCEYFASAMAVMLRSQGIAVRVVNGFHNGEYNETAGMYLVRQRHAHAWVEVYFPKKNVWVPFDPTPAAANDGVSAGFLARAGKYLDALDAVWIQYFVAFDNQGQRSLARTVRNGFVEYQAKTGGYLARLQATVGEWWNDVRGEKGGAASAVAAGYAVGIIAGIGAGIFVLVWLYRRIDLRKLWRRLRDRLSYRPVGSSIEFYERMQFILAKKGIVRQTHQTPLEFAQATGYPEAVLITQKYNQVRFGDHPIARPEADAIRSWLTDLAGKETTAAAGD